MVEYEVQNIVSHRIVRVGKKPTLQYEVKWKGYKSSENTWESSKSTENAQDLVDLYWDTKGGGQIEREKVERKLRGESSPSDEDEDAASEYSEEESKEEEEDDGDSDEEEEEEVAKRPSRASSRKRRASPVTKRKPSKRAKAAPTTEHRSSSNKERSKRQGGSKRVVVEEESDNESDISESEIEKGDFRAKSNNWKTDVEKVISVRNVEDDNELYALVRWRDGKIGLNKTSVVAQKNPQILIRYYEKRLAFEKRD